MTAKPRRQISPAPKGRNNSAQGNALGIAPPEAQSPEGAGQSGNLPMGWRMLTIEAMTEAMQYGSSAKTSEDASGVPVLRMGNIKDGALVLDSLKYLPRDHSEFPDLLLRDGDLLFNRTNSAELVGKSAVYRGNPEKCSCASYLIRVQLKPEFVPEYVANYLNSPFGRQWIASVVSQQVGQANVNGSKLKALSIPIPGFDDQRRIVAEIEKQFTRLEAGVAALRRVQANLKRYRAAVLKAACEGRLVPTEAELARTEDRPFESGQQLLARILTERRQNWQGRGQYKEPATLNKACQPELPKGWGVAPLEAIADVIDPNPSHRMPKYVPEGIPLVSSENFVGTEEIDFTIGKQVTRETLEQQRSRYTIEEGDFVLSRIGTIGKTRFLPTDNEYCLSHALVVLKVRSKFINKRWLRKTIASESILSQAHKGVQSVGVPDLGMAKIRDFIIPLPPLAEQTRIVAEVERRLSVVEELEAVVTTNLQRATRLRQSILKEAYSGALR